MAGRVCVFIATSLDGYIAGVDDDLSWLPQPKSGVEDSSGPSGSDPDALEFDEFFNGVGVLLMGRRTYDVVRGFEIPWPYGDKPVMVLTTRPLNEGPPETVTPVEGSIREVIRQAKAAAGENDVYLDGGTLIRQALEEGLVDEITVSLVPVVLGQGIPLFTGIQERIPLEISSHHSLSSGMVQLRMQPKRI